MECGLNEECGRVSLLVDSEMALKIQDWTLQDLVMTVYEIRRWCK